MGYRCNGTATEAFMRTSRESSQEWGARMLSITGSIGLAALIGIGTKTSILRVDQPTSCERRAWLWKVRPPNAGEVRSFAPTGRAAAARLRCIVDYFTVNGKRLLLSPFTMT